MNLSLEGVGSYSPPSSLELPGGSERLQKAGSNPQRKVHLGAGVLRRTPAVSPGSADEEDMTSVRVPQVIRVYIFICLSDHSFTSMWDCEYQNVQKSIFTAAFSCFVRILTTVDVSN